MIGLTFDGKIYTLGEKSKGGDYPFQLEKNVDKVIAASLNGFLAVTNDNKTSKKPSKKNEVDKNTLKSKDKAKKSKLKKKIRTLWIRRKKKLN